MPIQLTRHIRPITVRFTEPGVSDWSVDLDLFASIHAPSSPLDAATAPIDLLFDVIVEQPSTAAVREKERGPHPPADAGEARRDTAALERRAVDLLQGKGEETVRELKRRIRTSRPALLHRRLRLIHAGRILRDGIRLVSWLDSLDTHRKTSVRSIPGLGLDASPSDTESDSDADLDGSGGDRRWVQDGVETFKVRDLLSRANAGPLQSHEVDGKGKGKARAVELDERDLEGCGGVEVRVTNKLAERIYIQCSVGDVMEEEEEDRERQIEREIGRRPGAATGTTTAQIHGSAPIRPDPSSDVPHSEPFNPFALSDTEPDEAQADLDGETGGPAAATPSDRGFDRLLSAGLTPTEIETMRSQFHRSSGLSSTLTGDVLRRQEEEEHARALEDQWIESLNSSDIHGDALAGSGGSAVGGAGGMFHTIMEGLMLGFFVPLMPLFFLRERAHPSAFPAGDVGALVGRAPQRNDGTDEDDEEGEEAGGADGYARNITFSKTMQFAVVGGLAGNLIMGAFRLLW